MEKYSPKFSKVLLTSDPHYIPGYTGYCPQLKYSVGKPYAKHTADLLTSPEVKHSNHLVLQTGQVPSTESYPGLGDQIWRSNTETEKPTRKSIPGFTGFIPNRRNYFACTYTQMCHKALSEFYRNRISRIHRQSMDLPPVVNYTNQRLQKLNSPLTTITDEPIPYKPLTPWKPPGKPYSMGDDNPHKYFISGFTGHVPKSRFLFGSGYPIITNKALIQFGKQLRSDPRDSTLPSIPPVSPSSIHVASLYGGHSPSGLSIIAV
ncbi:protein FAM166B [Thalassophryne amazonica]|uniref:protein FAM166B n=1 Tax=Thalassophryne amazonica TaxID=390379 RepID=UPI001470BD25|nr:protein FAM166B [Thalassophryne amazonica]